MEGLANHPSVVVAFVAGGRSNDLFEYREFGDYGEASIITVIADEGACDEILNLLHTVCGLDSSKGVSCSPASRFVEDIVTELIN